MLRIREFEERVKRTFEEHPGVIRGHTHLADGAEASIVGSLAAIEAGDQLMTTYRCHGYPIALGTDTEGDHGRDLRPPGRPVRRLRRLDAPVRPGPRLPRARPGSSARGSRRRRASPSPPRSGGKQGQVVLCFFGDGASKQGAFHESLNLASLWKLPVVYVMENNSYNVATRVEQEDANAAAGEPLSVKAEGVQHARRDRRRRRPDGRLRDGRARPSTAPVAARARRWWSPRSTGCRPTAT